MNKKDMLNNRKKSYKKIKEKTLKDTIINYEILYNEKVLENIELEKTIKILKGIENE